MAKSSPLQCPFCENYLIAPVDIRIRTMDLTGGICRCGAVYVLDRSGHALGEIFMDALAFACKGDLDRALALERDEYETVELDYNQRSNSLKRGGGPGKLSKLMFVRLLK